jgi:hypothetical protein
MRCEAFLCLVSKNSNYRWSAKGKKKNPKGLIELNPGEHNSCSPWTTLGTWARFQAQLGCGESTNYFCAYFILLCIFSLLYKFFLYFSIHNLIDFFYDILKFKIRFKSTIPNSFINKKIFFHNFSEVHYMYIL